MYRTHRFVSVVSAVIAIAGVALTHDDDPKLLGRELPYRGPGFRSPLNLLGQPDGALPPSAQMVSCGSFQCSNGARLLSWLPLNSFSGNPSAGNDCWGYISPSGREYALFGHSEGTGVVEITNPGSPNVIANLPGPSSTWRDMKVFNQYMYVVSEGPFFGGTGGGIQIFDLSNIDAGQVIPLGAVTGGEEDTHNVAIDTDSGFLYRAGGGNNGIRIYNLNANPTNPPLVGSWSTNYVHDVQVVTYTSGPAAGKQVAYCSTGSSDTLRTLDVTNKSNIKSMDSISWPNSAYAHQSWLSEDKRYCYLNDELDEPPLKTTTYVFDVLDPSNIVYMGSFTNGNTAIGHNGYTRGGYLYEANYRSGLRVFDIGANPTNPPETFWFDTYPGSDSADFSGLWSCFPYFPSGVVIGSDSVRGLFVLWLGPPQLQISYPNGEPATISAFGQNLRVKISATAGAVAPGTEMLHYSTGAGFTSVPLISVGGELYDAPFPPFACNTQVNYYISATSTSNIVWTSPEAAPATTNVATATCPAGPFTYCVSKTNSCGGTPGAVLLGHVERLAELGLYAHRQRRPVQQVRFDDLHRPGPGQSAVPGRHALHRSVGPAPGPRRAGNRSNSEQLQRHLHARPERLCRRSGRGQPTGLPVDTGHSDQRAAMGSRHDHQRRLPVRRRSIRRRPLIRATIHRAAAGLPLRRKPGFFGFTGPESSQELQRSSCECGGTSAGRRVLLGSSLDPTNSKTVQLGGSGFHFLDNCAS